MIIDIYLIMNFFFVTKNQNEFFNYYNLYYNSITYNYLEEYYIYFIDHICSFNRIANWNYFKFLFLIFIYFLLGMFLSSVIDPLIILNFIIIVRCNKQGEDYNYKFFFQNLFNLITLTFLSIWSFYQTS